MKQQVDVMIENSRIPADGKSSTAVCLRFACSPDAPVKLRLSGSGSLSPDGVVRQGEFPVTDGEINLRVYAPRRPGRTVLVGEGIRCRITFRPASLVQELITEWVPTLAFSLVIALVLKSYAFANIYIPSGSMENTLRVHDMLIIDKLSYKVLGHDPQRGDIMVFDAPFETDQSPMIKRVIGLPGDTVEISGGQVLINGQPQEEDYIKAPPFRDFPRTVVPEGQYFMMGDNRNNSHDSRAWGTLERGQFEGRALFVFWPPSHARILPRE